MIGCGTGKIILKFPHFCQLNEEYQAFEFRTLEVPRSKFKKGGNFKLIFPVPYTLSYI